MGVPSVLALLLLFHLLFLHHSSRKCPDSFDRGTHGQIIYPLSNSTYPHCGLYTVQNFTDPVPKLNLGKKEVVLYELKTTNVTENSIRVNDPNLGYRIGRNTCDVFEFYLNWTLPPKLYGISFTISPGSHALPQALNLTRNKMSIFVAMTVTEAAVDTLSTISILIILVSRVMPVLILRLLTVRLLNCQGYRNSEAEMPVIYSPRWLLSLILGFMCPRSVKSVETRGGRCTRDITLTRFRCTNEKEGRSRLALILGTVVSTIGIMVILLFCIIMKKLSKGGSASFWKKKTENYRNIEAFLKNCGYLSLKRFSYSDVKKITNSFRTKLGQGGFGCVFKGKLKNDSLVAVKVLKGLKDNGEDFINEVATISRTSHVNIVTLLEFCFEGRHRALVYEFMPSGSLDNFIHDGGSSTYRQLGWDAMYRIAVGIAQGLEYLHRGCKTRILHFGIKPHNILLDENFCPKISDFGLAKLCPQKESIISLTGARGTAGYIAPEVFSRNFGGISHKSDVYSYGMMVLEMVGGRKNISVEVDRTSEIYFPHWVYKRLELDEELGLHGIMDGEAKASARKMIMVGLWCIQTDPSNRPSMSRVVEMLEGSVKSLQIPPSLICLLPREHQWIRPLLMS